MNQPKAVNVQPMAVAVISGDNIPVTTKKWFLVKSAVTRICPRVPTLRLLFVQGTIIVGTGKVNGLKVVRIIISCNGCNNL